MHVCSTLLDIWAKGRLSHILPRHYRDGRCRQIFLTKLLREMTPGVLPMTPNKATEFWMGWWDTPKPKKPKFRRSLIKATFKIFLDSQGVVDKEFKPEGKTVNAVFYIAVTDRLLKRIQQVRPAAFCTRYFVLLHDNPPAHKVANVCKFLTQKNVTNLLSLPIIFIFIFARIFSVPQDENKLKWLQFADVAGIQTAVTDELKRVQKEEFSAAFQKLYDCSKNCI